MGKIYRHENRELAFQVLYSLYFTKVETLADLQTLFLSSLETARQGIKDRDVLAGITAMMNSDVPIPERENEDGNRPFLFCWSIVRGVWEHRAKLDGLIARHSSRSLERIGRSELAILRMGTYELLLPDAADAKIILSEAIILAHDFGDENSYQFINGLLHAIATEIAQKKLSLADL